MNAVTPIGRQGGAALDPDLQLPVTLLLRYLFFLSRRPISGSNRHFLVERAAGLRALGDLIGGCGNAVLDTAASLIRRLTPATLADIARELTPLLTPLVDRDMDDDVLVTTLAPDRELLRSMRRIRLVLGPGIGIGDEAICLPLPSWMTGAGAAEVHVLTTRPELWAGVNGVTEIEPYSAYVSLLNALRGDGMDMVFLADFERPALAPSLSRGPSPARYVELSLGGRAFDVFDSERRCLHALTPPAPYFTNYYEFAAHALHWLGASVTPRQRAASLGLSRRQPALDRPCTVVISPFTSKYEPSAAAWTTLLGGVCSGAGHGAVRLVFDPGPSLATERFASSLLAATRAAVRSGVVCELASEAPARTLTLSGVLQLVYDADVVICADTFATHIASLGGCTTLVVASQALVHWRVPHAPVFYFDDDDTPLRIARGMRRVLAAGDRRFAAAWPPTPWLTPAGSALVADTARLVDATADGADPSTLLHRYRTCSAAMRQLVSELPDWPDDFASLLTDRPYHRLLPAQPAAGRLGGDAQRDDAVKTHLSQLLSRWENSNLHKYLVRAVHAQR